MSFSLSSLAQVGLLGAYTAGTYVDSMWGVAQFSLSNESPCMCAFVGDKKSVVGECCPLENKCIVCFYLLFSSPPLAVCMDGTFHKYTFTAEGNCFMESFDVFLDISDDQM